MFFWDLKYKINFALSSFLPHIENHKHKQCWLPRFGCWPQCTGKHQKPSLPDQEKKIFTEGQQILTQFLARRSLHQKIKLASLQCPLLRLPREWRRWGASESLKYFRTWKVKRNRSEIFTYYHFPSQMWKWKHCQIYNCVLKSNCLVLGRGGKLFYLNLLKEKIFSKLGI